MGKKQSLKRKRKMVRRQRRIKILFGLVCACLIVIFAIIYSVLYGYVSKAPEDKISQNVYIGVIDVSGMTREEAKKALDNHIATDKAAVVTMKVGKKKANATLEEMGLSYVDKASVAANAFNYGKKGSLWKRYRQLKALEKEKAVISEEFTLDKKQASAVIKERANPLADHAKDARLIKKEDGFAPEKEKEGKTVDIDASIEKIEKYLNTEWNHKDFSVKMTTKKEKPSVTSKDLETVQDELGTYTTHAGDESARLQNIKVGVDCIDGTILMPGERFSMNRATEPFDAEHGYVPAGSYENGQVVDTYGGGICQASTTLYNAVLYSELKVVERYPHSMLVDYVDPSRDAAIAGDILDFVFENNYEHPIYIAADIDEENNLTFSIFGKETRKKGRTVDFESETVKMEEHGTTYKENPKLPLGSIQNTGSPHTGVQAQLWKIVYQDGVEESRDVINYSNYEKIDVIYEVGTQTDNAEAASIVRNAIGTQDLGSIQEAINKAYALL